MPRIPEDTLRCVFFLFESEEHAHAGSRYGGTGFFILYGKCKQLYAVANYHVAVQGGCSVIRTMNSRGESHVIPLDPSDWSFISGGPDIAVAAIRRSMLPVENFTRWVGTDPRYLRAIDSSQFALQKAISRDQIGPGEDVFMIGRFIDHDGVDKNLPAVRFGNISAMPAPVVIEGASFGECYTLDMHSRSGFSGSPVFAFRTLGQDLVDGGESRRKPDPWGTPTTYQPVFRLLGIHIGQFPERLPIKHAHASASGSVEQYALGLSGMTIAAPAWDIVRVIEVPELAEFQATADLEFEKTVEEVRRSISERDASSK